MDPATETPKARVAAMLWGFRMTSLLVAAVQLGLIDRLLRGPASSAELAEALKADAPALARLLRALAAYGFVEAAQDRYSLTETGQALHELRDFAQLIGAEYMPAWGRLEYSLRTGKPAFEHVFGLTVWEHRQAHPSLNEALNRTMQSYQAAKVAAILEACDFSDLGLLIDVGAGYGTEAIEVLKGYPGARAILFDQPHVVPGTQARVAESGLLERCEVLGGSFLEEVPTGGTVYLLKHVLHNWPDAVCVQLLRNCRAGMSADSRLLVIERLLPDAVSTERPDGHWDLGLVDIHMLAVLGGQERSLAHLDALFAEAGLVRTGCRDARGVVHVVEARIPIDGT